MFREAQAGVALGKLERLAGRGESDAVATLTCPERAPDAAGEEELGGCTAVEPRRRHGAVELLQRAGVAGSLFGKREDRLGIDRHLRLGAFPAVLGEELLVVDDDPVVDPDDRTVGDRVVVGTKGQVALRVVADVDEDLGRFRRDANGVEELAGPGALLPHLERNAGSTVAVPHRVGAAFGDRGKERLRDERPVDGARCAEAVSGDSAHRVRYHTPRRRTRASENVPRRLLTTP